MTKELKFLEKHSNELFKKYRGKYIAIAGDKLVASGQDFLKVARKAEKVSKEPVFMKIPKDDVVVYADRISIY